MIQTKHEEIERLVREPVVRNRSVGALSFNRLKWVSQLRPVISVRHGKELCNYHEGREGQPGS